MSAAERNSRIGLALLNLSVWIVDQAWLRILYRRLPQRVRSFIFALLIKRSRRRTQFARTPNWKRPQPVSAVLRASVAVGPDAGGVNIFGYMRGQFGLAESARMYAKALIDNGIPVALHDLDLGLPHGWDDHSLDEFITEEAPHRVSIIFVNPDYLQQAFSLIGPEKLKDRYLIACWFWELEQVPAEWLPAIGLVDEIMVASKFVEDAFRKVTDKPILRIPLPLNPVEDSGLQRADFGIQEGKFTFLCTFDFHSWIRRKNPFGVIEAFRIAFPSDRDDVRLLVKSSNGHRHPNEFLQLLNAAAPDRRIVVRDDVIDKAHMHALQRCCDAYVSLHRSEGFGLGMAECMAIGQPVVATRWSGNLEFMNSDNSYLVDFDMVPVKADDYPSAAHQFWAEPNLAQAGKLMRAIADSPLGARALGRQAAADVAKVLSPKLAAEKLAEHLFSVQSNAALVPFQAKNHRSGTLDHE